jgi:hypothetical protein
MQSLIKQSSHSYSRVSHHGTSVDVSVQRVEETITVNVGEEPTAEENCLVESFALGLAAIGCSPDTVA